MRARRPELAAAVVGVAMVIATVAVTPARAASFSIADFNHDGFGDAALAAPLEDTRQATDTGAVNVLYGSIDAFKPRGNQIFNQNTEGVPDSTENGDHFGSALATGDFDGDGFQDLAMGVPDESISGQPQAGAVNVVYGTENRLTGFGSQRFDEDKKGISNIAQANEHFGAALAAGDFNGDGKDDLAVGVPGQEINGKANAGSIHVIYGSENGLAGGGDRVWAQDSTDATGSINDTSETDDFFGTTLAAGDFTGDGKADLAIGVPMEDVGATDDGLVNVIQGSSEGLVAHNNQAFSQETNGIPAAGANDEHFGQALASGDVNGDGKMELAIGVPNEDFNGVHDSGSFFVLYGDGPGLRLDNLQLWGQDTAEGDNHSEDGDHLGSSLAFGDVTGDGHADLAIGVPDEDLPEDVDNLVDAGGVLFMKGSVGGVSGHGDSFITQDFPLIPGEPSNVADHSESGDRFGASVSLADVNNDGEADLLVGAPLEDVKTSVDAGGANIIFGLEDGFSGWDRFLSQNLDGLKSSAEPNDHFGAAVATLGGAR